MYSFFGKQISGKFTIPSGIITTSVATIQWIADNIPEVGIITTKSIGLEPRSGNREPVYLEYGDNSFMNAVGLSNPGVEKFVEQLDELELPEDKFLLCSIFGSSVEEFYQTAEKLKDKVDGFELNVSCPHATNYGQSIGEDFDLTVEIIKKIKPLGKPVLVKPSPNVPKIEELVKRCEEAGVDGFVAINTVGPGFFTVDGKPVLANKVGGMSGKAVLPIGLKVVKQIRENSDLPIIACGGIVGKQEVDEYAKVGAEFFGIGSSLTGLKSEDLISYFKTLEKDLKSNHNNAIQYLKKDKKMQYQKTVIKEKIDVAEDLVLLKFDIENDAKFGQFAFLWIPGIGEKPFSVYDNKPMSFLIQKVGIFTEQVMKLQEGDEVYIRGNYGTEIPLSGKVLVVSGGCGVASFKVLTEREDLECCYVFGTRTTCRTPDQKSFEKSGEFHLATDDGTEGYHGFVTEILEDVIEKFKPDYCVNCGPRPMLLKVEGIEKKHIDRTKIYSSFEELTKCGVGICGSCARADGLRSCVDGPFLNPLEDRYL